MCKTSSPVAGLDLKQACFRKYSIAIALGVGFTLFACVSEHTSEQQNTDALAAYPGFHRWPNNITICFANASGFDSSTFNSVKAATFSTLQSTWDATSALGFTLGADCSPIGTDPIPSGNIRVRFVHGQGFGHCSGNGITGDCEVAIDDLASVQSVAVHEVGHALGFAHEHQRASAGTWEIPLCPFEELRWNEANAVVTANHSLCFNEAAGTSTDRITAGDGTESCPPGFSLLLTVPIAQGWYNDRTAVSLNDLTTFDPLSIMNYCNGVAGRAPGNSSLTALDALGAEIMYPFSMTRALVVGPGAVFSSSSGLIARSDSYIMTDWSSRGASDAVFSTVLWELDSNSATESSSVKRSLSDWTNGTHSVQFLAVDVFGRGHNGSAVLSLVPDNGLHTALVSALLPTLLL